ncbi:hypothetical protein PpBr36_04015 [Pyricularia pennisetigena]|uniref:hypothetical protein n=1 Tax=Pyricularia pennisetigena TaxID=1578925 RepID=UPI00114F0C06|nr:hypothetical protein PpBr36_04015 [Pyricularia pennisetigena]TLS26978.1 hypothetical protein PpBr36_04015 [Pyricularia pennisetigena]
MTKDQGTGYGTLQTAGQQNATTAGSSPSSSTDGRAAGRGHDDGEVGARGAGDAPESSQPRDGEEVLAKLKDFYTRNLGLLFVFLAQGCGACMSVAAKLLINDASASFNALHVIFVRMLATAILGLLYMWCKSVPDAPFGDRSVRGLLLLRGASGFSGLLGLYYSLSYLPLSDATFISFIIPTITAIVCFVFLKEPMTKHETFAGVLAFTGVLLIARPSFLFGSTNSSSSSSSISPNLDQAALLISRDHTPSPPLPPAAVSATQRTLAIMGGVGGCFCAATSYATIRVIGKRAHSLVSVNYFAMVATVGSAVAILLHPDLEFVFPDRPRHWLLFLLIGVAGFLLQFLLTEGLQREKAGRATNLIYTQIVFVLVTERIIWGTVPSSLSLVGGLLIIVAGVWTTLQKQNATTGSAANVANARSSTAEPDEETGLLGSSSAGLDRRT